MNDYLDKIPVRIKEDEEGVVPRVYDCFLTLPDRIAMLRFPAFSREQAREMAQLDFARQGYDVAGGHLQVEVADAATKAQAI